MISFLTTDPKQLLAEAVSRYEGYSGESLMPGDEHYIFLAQQVELVVAAREEINRIANQNLLRYAEGEILDAYGEQFDVERRPASHATVTLEFRLMAALSFDVQIPRGARVTPDGKLNFIVQDGAVIPAGDTAARADAVAEEAGALYNGFLPNQIRSIVDPIEYVDSVTNVTASAGGADVQDDDSYREQIRLSWEAISTCGCKEGYEYWARTAPWDIVDVEAVSNANSEITIYVLMEDASTPSQKVLDDVLAATSADKRRPLTDKVTAQAAVTKAYHVRLTYYIDQNDATDEAKIKKAVESAVSDYVATQKRSLGGNLNPDMLRRAILRAGGYRIDITEPVFTELQPQEVAVPGTISITYGGLL